MTWTKRQVSEVLQTCCFCWLCRVCPPIFKSKTPKPGKSVPWKRPRTTPTPSNPKCQAKAISCNLATCGNELSREVRPLFSLSKSWLGPFPFLQLGCFPAKRFPPLGSQLANCSSGKPGQQVVLPFVKLAKKFTKLKPCSNNKGTYYTYKSINKLIWKLYQKSIFLSKILGHWKNLVPKKTPHLRRVLFPWLNLGPWTSHLSGFRPSYGCPKWSPLQVLSISKEPVLCGFLSLLSTQWQKSPNH